MPQIAEKLLKFTMHNSEKSSKSKTVFVSSLKTVKFYE